jgi:hypothetical protein
MQQLQSEKLTERSRTFPKRTIDFEFIWGYGHNLRIGAVRHFENKEHEWLAQSSPRLGEETQAVSQIRRRMKFQLSEIS